MRTRNIETLLKSSYFYDELEEGGDTVIDSLIDYLDESGLDLDTLNVDDILCNSLSSLTADELKQEGYGIDGKDITDDYFLLGYNDEGTAYFLQ